MPAHRALPLLLVSLMLALAPLPARADADDPVDVAERARNAAQALGEILGAPDKGIPRRLLDDSECVAVIPKVVKGGFIVAARHGKGFVSCRTVDGWSRPAFVSISGGSFGLQVGVEASDHVLIFANHKAVKNLFEDNLHLGGNASVAAGPVGRSAEAGTDIKLDSEVYAYSRSKGIFLGISLEGAKVGIDGDNNRGYYGADTTASALLTSSADGLEPPLDAFVKALAAHAPAPRSQPVAAER
jgi:lipid-binding SYLF domain-containing protein